MVRIIVTTEQNDHLLLDEQVGLVHLSEGHAAEQLMERLRWAVTDAEDAERSLADGNGNGNGHANGHRNGNGNGSAHRNGNGNGNGHRPVDG
jgi:hypothetical protein